MMNTSQKLIALLSGAALLSVSSLAAQTATTAPVGYVTETIKSAAFNVLGLNLSNEIIVSGAFESSSASTATDSEANFSTALPSGSDYVLRVTSGAGNIGLNTTVSASAPTVLTTDDDLSSVISAGTTYEVRRVQTISNLFGPTNSAELEGGIDGDSSAADIVWIPDGLGGYTRIYYNATARPFPSLTVGWKTTDNADAADFPVYFTSGILIQVQRSAFGVSEAGVDPGDLTSKDITLTGSVITEDTQAIVETGFNFVSRVLPADVTLVDSQLELDIVGGLAGNTSSADIIWLPDGLGGYTRVYYNSTARPFPSLTVGWKTTDNADASAEVLTSGFIVERKGAPTMITMRIPSSISL